VRSFPTQLQIHLIIPRSVRGIGEWLIPLLLFVITLSIRIRILLLNYGVNTTPRPALVDICNGSGAFFSIIIRCIGILFTTGTHATFGVIWSITSSTVLLASFA
jgi:hypothetical protein